MHCEIYRLNDEWFSRVIYKNGNSTYVPAFFKFVTFEELKRDLKERFNIDITDIKKITLVRETEHCATYILQKGRNYCVL